MYIKQSVLADQTHHSTEQKRKHQEEEKLRRNLKTKDQAEKNYAPADFVKLVILSHNKD